MDKVGLYSGTFDPVTNGHLDVIERGYELFDRLYITVAQNINKKTLAELNALMDSEKTTLEHVELNEADLSDEIIQEFDCGNDDMNEYLYDYARDDSVYGRGVTYVLVADDRKRIYAYATLKTHSLYYYEEEK